MHNAEPDSTVSTPSAEQIQKAVGLVHKAIDLDSTVSVAIAIRRLGRRWCHLGLLVRLEEETSSPGALELIHLAFHYRLSCERELDGYYCAVPMIPKERIVHIVALCDVVKERYPDGKLAFAVRYLGEKFDPVTGEYLSGIGRGLTCATFVLALLRTIGIDLIALETWKIREEDTRWHLDDIVPALIGNNADTEHIEAVKAQSPCARFRPQEVMAAMTTDFLPVAFSYAEPVGEAIQQSLPIVPLL